MALRVLIVDDHPDFRAIATTLLRAGGLDVVGEAWDGPSALAACTVLRPELALIDVHLSGEDGFELCESLLDRCDLPVVVMTSSREAGALRRRLQASRALGFIPKAELSGARLLALAQPS